PSLGAADRLRQRGGRRVPGGPAGQARGGRGTRRGRRHGWRRGRDRGRPGRRRVRLGSRHPGRLAAWVRAARDRPEAHPMTPRAPAARAAPALWVRAAPALWVRAAPALWVRAAPALWVRAAPEPARRCALRAAVPALTHHEPQEAGSPRVPESSLWTLRAAATTLCAHFLAGGRPRPGKGPMSPRPPASWSRSGRR